MRAGRGRRPLGFPAVMVAAVLVLAGPFPERAEAATKAQLIQRRLTNRVRKVDPGKTVRLDQHLSGIARRHSARMARRGELYHNPHLVRDLGDRRWKVAGENVGVVGRTGSLRKTLGILHDAFMDSRPHRENIIYEPFRKIGVGLARSDGRVWVTVVFLG